jgi:hypothetical protein
MLYFLLCSTPPSTCDRFSTLARRPATRPLLRIEHGNSRQREISACRMTRLPGKTPLDERQRCCGDDIVVTIAVHFLNTHTG